MKKALTLMTALLILFTLAGCGREGDGIVKLLDNVASAFGSTQLTKDADLIGTREKEDA